jgi:hypothetical protein
MSVLRRILRTKLCPKALLCNISEFDPMKQLFTFAKERSWSPRQLAATYLVGRGIRGREGVQVLHDFCVEETPTWDDNSCVMRFVGVFETKWRQEVLRTGKVSALSHQEHLHAGLSGMNFVETLKERDVLDLLFGPGGIASRLASFFERPEGLDADALLGFYKELVKEPMSMTTTTYFVQTEGARILGKKQKAQGADTKRMPTVSDGSYNSMDFLRCFSNIMTEVFSSPDVLFTPALWSKMLQCQSKPAETKELLSYFDMDMSAANTVIQETPGMNWSTFLVCLCEVRQAMGNDRDSFIWLLEKLEVRPWLQEAVDDVVEAIVDEGATSKECYCVRLCAQVHAWLDSVGTAVPTDIDEW